MTIESMLDVENLTFLEPDYSSLINSGEPAIILKNAERVLREARMLIDENENPVVFAVESGFDWSATSWSHRNPTAEEIGIFESLDGEIYQENRADIDSALREYFSRRLVSEISPSADDLTAERVSKVESLIQEYFGEKISGVCIDACCGSGVGASILRNMGGEVLAYDNDAGLIALGIAQGRLIPKDTACIDAKNASAYMPDADFGLGIMFGQMYEYTKDLWQPIVEELAGITSKTLITVATNQEALWVKEWAANVGRELEIFENERDEIYDRWVCFG
ncbi:MAG: hypothetical protein Q4Q53_03755 [Methanocorpusculum sp.]|nr:hypothetical protein [Methanocorpusculum sp.]